MFKWGMSDTDGGGSSTRSLIFLGEILGISIGETILLDLILFAIKVPAFLIARFCFHHFKKHIEPIQ